MTAPSGRTRRWWRRWKVCLAMLAAGGGLFLFALISSEWRLRAALARLDAADPGWRFDQLQAAREAIPDEENSAPVVLQAAALFPEGWPSSAAYFEFDKLTPGQPLAPPEYGHLANDLSELGQALAKARRLTSFPRGRHTIVYARPNPYQTNLSGHQSARDVVLVLERGALQSGEDGDSAQALRDCRAIVNAGRSIGDEPVLISQQVRAGCVTVACKAIERVLARGEPPSEELAALQQLLADEDRFPGLAIGARGERAMLQEVLASVESGETSLSNALTGWFGGARGSFIDLALRPTIKGEHPRLLEIATRNLAATRLPPNELQEALLAMRTETTGRGGMAYLARAFIPDYVTAAESFRQTSARVRCVIVGLAAERFRRARSQWPVRMDDLCPDYLNPMAVDPYDGQPLRLRQTSDGLVVYSVGPDRIDNHGLLVEGSQGTHVGVDVGMRLWDGSRRRP